MADHIVRCRICSKTINTDKEYNWIMPERTKYYHKECYYDLQKNKDNVLINRCDNFWREALLDFLIKDLKLPNIDYAKMGTQWKNLRARNFRAKGIYLTIRYLYLIKHNDPNKALGGIGIINEENYREAEDYWKDLEKRKISFKQQLKSQTEHTTIKLIREKEAKAKYNLDDIGGED